MSLVGRTTAALVFSMILVAGSGAAYADAGHAAHEDGHDDVQGRMDTMREMHRGHAHMHDFEAMEEISPEQMARMMGFMRDVGLVMPAMNPVRGRKLFLETGCIACHSINGIGGDLGPSLNAGDMPSPMNAFEFAARMWRGAAAMTVLQEEELGGVINLTGQDLADLIAFAHDDAEQKNVTEAQVPERFREKLAK